MSEKAVIVLEFPFSDLSDVNPLQDILDGVREFFARRPEDTPVVHMAIRESADAVLAVFTEEEDEVGFIKHGEGSIIPESEQQKVAAKTGMTQSDQDALRRENEEADAAPDGE